MKIEVVVSTISGNQAEVKAEVFMDRDFVDGRCVRCDQIIEVEEVYMNGKELSFDDMNDRNKELIYDAIKDEV